MGLAIGVSLPTAGDRISDVAGVAAAAEAAGFDSLWVGDHLADGRPILDCTIALAVAAAVTSRVRLGFGVLQAALRPPAWVAKQVGTLQYLSGHRVELGIGIGGSVPDEWAAAGVPLAERARRTDRLLALLPDLLTGKPTRLNGVEIALSPPVPPPPLWIGGDSNGALRRAGTYGAGWLAAVTSPGRIAEAVVELSAFPAPPKVGCVVFAAGGGNRRELADFLSSRLGLTPASAAETAVAGTPGEMAEQLSRYVAAGVEHLVLTPFGPGRQAQFEMFAEVRRRLLTLT